MKRVKQPREYLSREAVFEKFNFFFAFFRATNENQITAKADEEEKKETSLLGMKLASFEVLSPKSIVKYTILCFSILREQNKTQFNYFFSGHLRIIFTSF